MALKREAAHAAALRFHTLAWALQHGEIQSIWTGTCTMCGAIVQVKARPAPNEIDIGGDAVAVNCPEWRRRYGTP